MDPILPRKTFFDKLDALIAQPDKLADIHAETTIPESIIQWLGRLKVLYGVPFNYLVPDEQMLPKESIRFFQVDLNWIYSLVEGAYDIGRSTSGDLAHDAVFSQQLQTASTQAARQIRTAQPVSKTTSEHVTGFLLRSAVVEGWPGLEVTAYDATNLELTTVLRMERLTPSILLFLVEGIIDHVDIHEPAEGLHFGLDLSGKKSLRSLSAPQPGAQMTDPDNPKQFVEVEVPFRPGRVIKINQLAHNMQKTLGITNANNFTSAEFALEMVEGVQAVRFVRKLPDIHS